MEEAKDAPEMRFVGSTPPIMPIIMWDEQPIKDGKNCPLCLKRIDAFQMLGIRSGFSFCMFDQQCDIFSFKSTIQP